MIAVRVIEKLTREMGGADDDGAGDRLVRFEWNIANAVEGGIHRAEVGEVDRFVGVLLLVFAQRKQALSPVDVGIADEFVAGGGVHEWREVREVVGRVAQRVGGVYDQQAEEKIENGAALLLVSLGLVECEGHSHGSRGTLGIDRIKQILQTTDTSTARSLCTAVVDTASQFGAKIPACDDRTALALVRNL